MFKDYSGTFVMVQGRNKVRNPRKNSYAASRELFPVTSLIWKTIGAMLLATLVIGISSTVWYGMKVQIALDQIGNSRAINLALHNEKSLLLAQRDLLLSQSKMEEAAQKLGLRTPGENQLRYP
jgi:hypothetical protein